MILTDGTTSLTLPDDLDWPDWFSWSPVDQTADTSITGALILQSAAATAGRPITLSGDDNRAWVPLDTVNQLASWSRTPGQVLTLTARGQTRSVVFRHHDKPAFTARDIFGNVPESPDQQFAIELRLMEI